MEYLKWQVVHYQADWKYIANEIANNRPALLSAENHASVIYKVTHKRNEYTGYIKKVYYKCRIGLGKIRNDENISMWENKFIEVQTIKMW